MTIEEACRRDGYKAPLDRLAGGSRATDGKRLVEVGDGSLRISKLRRSNDSSTKGTTRGVVT